MIKLIYGHWLKTKRSPIRLAILILPIMYSTVIFTYLFAVQNVYFKDNIRVLFLFFSICALFFLSVFVPMIYNLDKNAGNYANELRIGINRKILFFSKFLFIITLLISTIFIALLVFLFLEINLTQMSFKIVKDSNLLFYFLTCITTLAPIIVVYQFISLKYSYSGSLIAGILFTLSSILMGTTDLGGNTWSLIPWVWPIRLIFYHVGRFSSTLIFNEYLTYLTKTTLLTIVLLVAVAFWYNNWEGISNLED